MTSLRKKMRARRARRQFATALDNATPTMRAELLALASRQNFVN